jgi:ketosteroid isomerase-like protein
MNFQPYSREKLMLRFVSIIACSLLFGFLQVAQAGPLDEAKAKAHLKAAADGDMDAVMRDYTEDAYMDWVGGKLDGRYRGKAAIGDVWKKFIANGGGKPRPVTFGKLTSHSNPTGTSVEMAAEYGGEKPVKVWHVLTYRDGQLMTEIWQIAPAINIAP